MKVLISGAGPAGLIAAYWLKRYGYNPTIVERAQSLLVGGHKIDVRGAALQVIKQMGIHDAVVAARSWRRSITSSTHFRPICRARNSSTKTATFSSA